MRPYIGLAAACLNIMAVAAAPGQHARPQALDLLLPERFPEGQTAAAVVCRDSSGRWQRVEWQVHAMPPLKVTGPGGARCRVLMRPSSAAAYAASNEVTWGEQVQPVRVHASWLRTVLAPPAPEAVFWIGATDAAGVECDSSVTESRCLFVPAEVPGAMLSAGAGGVLIALVSRGAGASVSWRHAPSGRIVRVRAPGAGAVTARAITVQRSLKQGAGHLREARVAPSVSILPFDSAAFWLEGTAPGAYLELQSPGAAITRLPLESLAGPASIPVDVRLSIEEVIDGTVRSRNAPAEGTTVILSRLIQESTGPIKEDEMPLERIVEVVTGEGGQFRFDGLGRDRYEILAVHPSRGRARALITPPAYPRLDLKPRATVRGRVLENGIPAPSALVQMLPSLEAVAAARNPILLATEPTHTRSDGRFQVIAPDEGTVVLAITTGRSSHRIDLGDAASLGEAVDLGDIRLEEPRELEVFLDLPEGCRLQAAGPLGVAGLTVLAPAAVRPGVWRFAPSAEGRWLFAAVCADGEVAIDPGVVEIRPGHRDAIVLKVRR